MPVPAKALTEKRNFDYTNTKYGWYFLENKNNYNYNSNLFNESNPITKGKKYDILKLSERFVNHKAVNYNDVELSDAEAGAICYKEGVHRAYMNFVTFVRQIRLRISDIDSDGDGDGDVSTSSRGLYPRYSGYSPCLRSLIARGGFGGTDDEMSSYNPDFGKTMWHLESSRSGGAAGNPPRGNGDGSDVTKLVSTSSRGSHPAYELPCGGFSTFWKYVMAGGTFVAGVENASTSSTADRMRNFNTHLPVIRPRGCEGFSNFKSDHLREVYDNARAAGSTFSEGIHRGRLNNPPFFSNLDEILLRTAGAAGNPPSGNGVTRNVSTSSRGFHPAPVLPCGRSSPFLEYVIAGGTIAAVFGALGIAYAYKPKKINVQTDFSCGTIKLGNKIAVSFFQNNQK